MNLTPCSKLSGDNKYNGRHMMAGVQKDAEICYILVRVFILHIVKLGGSRTGDFVLIGSIHSTETS